MVHYFARQQFLFLLSPLLFHFTRKMLPCFLLSFFEDLGGGVKEEERKGHHSSLLPFLPMILSMHPATSIGPDYCHKKPT
uniref:Putative ovule protein n=1 Tax=Solanum chacoense TaxID=4108 RepID=A0A0V0GZU7_SOLCH